jgi:hypothetical protein
LRVFFRAVGKGDGEVHAVKLLNWLPAVKHKVECENSPQPPLARLFISRQTEP